MEIKTIATGSSGNCYLLTAQDGSQLIIECGIPWKQLAQAMRWNFTRVVGVLITHEHSDHARCVKQILDHIIPVYCSEGTATALGIQDDPIHWHRLDPMHPTNIGREWVVEALPTEHDAADPMMFLILKDYEFTLFATDTTYIPYKFKDLTHIMVEANYSMEGINDSVAGGAVCRPLKKRVMESHMEIDTLAQWLTIEKEEGYLDDLKDIHLIHISKKNGDEAAFVKKIEEIAGVPVYIG